MKKLDQYPRSVGGIFAILCVGVLLFLTFAYPQEPVPDPQSALTFTVDYTGTPNEVDFNTALFLIDTENTRRAGLEVPGTPLLKSNSAEVKASAKEILGVFIQNAWERYLARANDVQGYVAGAPAKTKQELEALRKNSTDAGKAAAIAAYESNQKP